ncbi:MAG: 2-amino-4-hydroxy-6-hydroxymethyldihydropteridine diphosphokinase [Chloroflexota bacterium]|nr:2-amino-4-hydroxy-6-hydroxymethyldihydropteridine diphosphokinase [Chloroflexota bacterium]
MNRNEDINFLEVGMPATAYLGLGSNLGDRRKNLKLAIERLSQNLIIKKKSSVYETEPVGYEEQPLFLNMVISVITRFKPLELLHFIKQVEAELGRKPSFRNAPRLIDIDILFYENIVLQTDELTIPHQLMTERAFVLAPLSEIAPDLVHPVSQTTVADLLANAGGLDGIKIVEAIQ